MSENTSSRMELTSEQYPDEEQDLILGEMGMEESRLSGVIAGGLVITWHWPGIGELLSFTRTTLGSRASPHSRPLIGIVSNSL